MAQTLPSMILQAIPHAAPEVVPILLTEYDRQVLRGDIFACTRCPLHLATTTRVPWSGDRSPITIVGDAPSEQDEQYGEPFVGRSGNLLDSMLRSAGLVRNQIATANVICCRPPADDFAHAVTVEAPALCRDNLVAQLDFTESWLIVAMGPHALNEFKPKNSGIAKERGKPFWWQARLVLPTLHPSEALEKSAVVTQITEDFKLARRLLAGDELPECRQIDPVVVRGFRAPTDAKTIKHFDRYGWAVLFSPFLNSRVAVERRGVKAPRSWDHAYSFTPEFVAKMRGATPSMWSATAALYRELGAVPL